MREIDTKRKKRMLKKEGLLCRRSIGFYFRLQGLGCYRDDRGHEHEITAEEENKKLRQRIAEFETAADIVATELEEPALGVPPEAALSGFEAAWTERAQDRYIQKLNHALFPPPSQKVQSAVVVPQTNRHLSRNERVWRRSGEPAIRKYNQRH